MRLRLVTDASTPRGYLARLAACDAALDAQPFAACNTMQDLLTLAVPAASLANRRAAIPRVVAGALYAAADDHNPSYYGIT